MAATPSTSSSAADPGAPGPLARLWPRLWPHLRAAVVAFHLLAVTLDALPSPASGMSRSAWKDPTVQGEFRRWAGFLGVDQKELESRLWDFAQGFVQTRQTVMAPFNPWLQATGTWQAWQMFVAPHRFPTRMQLQILPADAPGADRASPPDAAWQTVFEERSPDHDWQAARFDTERLRASIFRWGWPNYQNAWKAACKQFTAELAAEHTDPPIRAVRCRMFKQESPSPEQIRSGTIPEGRWVFSLTNRLDVAEAP